ncbi:MAG: right-handed parallel beta-helix repeat-containing protein [Gaiellaceae bacterium]
MSYTLRGRLESRLAAALLPFLVACALALALQSWWPVQLAGLMLAVGLALDATAYHRLLPYQPGWAALPLGALELGLVMGLARAYQLPAPLGPALLFFAGAWLVAQVLTHAGFPLLHLSYGDDGGELGRGGTVLDAAAPAALALVLGVAWVTQPPIVRLAAGVHQGPLVLDRAQRLIGQTGAVVHGGIVITADDVTVRNVAVVGGEVGIEIRNARGVVLDDVAVMGSELDGISARRSAVTIRDCRVHSLTGPSAQGIDISFGMSRGRSVVEGCTVIGGQEGIVTHMAHATLRGNHVSGTRLRGITMTEMSMGEVEENDVAGALGVGIFCGDYSLCRIERNVVHGTRTDAAGGRTRAGYAIQAHYGASVLVDGNRLEGNPHGLGAFINAEIRPS